MVDILKAENNRSPELTDTINMTQLTFAASSCLRKGNLLKPQIAEMSAKSVLSYCSSFIRRIKRLKHGTDFNGLFSKSTAFP